MRLAPDWYGLVALALSFAPAASAWPQAQNCPASAVPKRIIAAIGIDDYEHKDRWERLTTAVADADAMEQVLHDKYGYQPYRAFDKQRNIEVKLRDRDATEDAIDSMLDDLGKLCPQDDLIIFFSGHGTVNPDNPQKGYIVPSDAHSDGFNGAHLIDVKEFLGNVNDLRARHILVILDACHSGIAIEEAKSGGKDEGKFVQAAESEDSRKVITSARAHEVAADKGPIPGHSLFGGILWQALNTGAAADGNNFIADINLATFLQEKVPDAPDSHQSPDFGLFGTNRGGSLVLPLDVDAATLYRHAAERLVADDFDGFETNARKLIERDPTDPRALAMQYRMDLRLGKMEDAAGAIDSLLAKANVSPDLSLPLAHRDLINIKYQLGFWHSALGLPISTSKPPLMVRVFTGETEQHLIPASGTGNFSVRPEANVFFKLQSAKETTYVYAVMVDSNGYITPEGDFVPPRENPVEPQADYLSGVKIGPEANDIQEWHLFFSQKSLEPLTSPPAEGSRVDPVDPALLLNVTHYVVTVHADQTPQ